MNPTLRLYLRALIPVAIGVGVVAWLMADEFSISQFKLIPWTGRTMAAIAIAMIFVVGREYGMMMRWRVLTDRKLSWSQTFKVTMMAEFTSAVTPTTAGGSALSMVFLHREGIDLGRGASLTLITLMLDELFVVVACPLLLIFIPSSLLFGFEDSSGSASDLQTLFWIVYGGICLVTILLYLGAFVIPHRIASFLSRMFSFRLLRRWQPKVDRLGRDLTAAGRDLRQRPVRWWLQALAATVISWVSRYLVVNALFWGFSPAAPQFTIFARQFVVWTLLTVSPTPGGSGISEWLFTRFYGDLIGNLSMALIIAIVWRVVSYYIYLLFGVAMLPSWLRKSKKTGSMP